ncbi:hypothetical protein HAX54_033901 [Datura stramonium]|uniref:Uncharacterized protein n=1 Tax=Datura stramonium TaxID=4076 RepID=A0ABS8VEA6_DATST|nr:hypothetical protein [Datura stramonium]
MLCMVKRRCSLFRFVSQTCCAFTFPFAETDCIKGVEKERQSGSVRSTKLMLESAYFIASKLKILPEPLDAILREFGGGNGGGGGFSFGSGHGWGGFDGWRGRRRKKINWGFWVVFFAILGVGLWLILWKRLEIDVFLGVLGLTLFGFSINAI